MKKKYEVELTEAEQSQLTKMTMKGNLKARKLKRIQILLLSNKGKSDKEIAEHIGVSIPTIGRIRKEYVEGGMEEAINEKPRSGRPQELDGKQRAKVTALACSKPPEGRGRWTLRLLAKKAVELEFVPAVSHQSVQDILKKMS